MEFLSGSVARLYEFGMHSMRAPDGVLGLVVTVNATSEVLWARGQFSGMNTPFKNSYVRIPDVLDTLFYETVADVKLAPWYTGHMQSETDQTIKGNDGNVNVRNTDGKFHIESEEDVHITVEETNVMVYWLMGAFFLLTLIREFFSWRKRGVK